MTRIHFAHPLMLALLAVLPIVFVLIRRGIALRRLALLRFGVSEAKAGFWSRAAFLAAVLLVILGLAQPSIAPDGKNFANDNGDAGEIVFLLDVSRSMLTDDVQPNRLERAKQAIGEFVSQRPGERVALIAFAGTQSVECALTNDIVFFQEMLKRTGPGSVSRGGTRIGDAMRFALRSAFDDLVEDRKRLVLVTDGGDHDRNPWPTADELERRKVSLIIGGVGSELRDSIVPVSMSDRTPLLYHGQPVQTHLEAAALRKLAKTASGEYRDLSEAPLLPRSDQAVANIGRQRARLAGIVLAAIAFTLLLAESLLSKVVRTRGIAIGLIAALMIGRPVRLSAQESAEDWAQRAREAFEIGNYYSAVEFYKTAVKQSNGRLDLVYNLACTLYSRGQYDEALKEFSKVQSMAAKASDLEWKSRKGRADALYWMSADADRSPAEFMLVTALREYRELAKIRPDMTDAAFNADVVERRLAEIRKGAPSGRPPRGSKDAKSSERDGGNGTAPSSTGLSNMRQRTEDDRDW